MLPRKLDLYPEQSSRYSINLQETQRSEEHVKTISKDVISRIYTM